MDCKEKDQEQGNQLESCCWKQQLGSEMRKSAQISEVEPTGFIDRLEAKE